MQVHDVTAKGHKHEVRKRVGRGIGSGLGKMATRGRKGQRSRSGDNPRIGFEGGQMPLYRRMPKRGFNNPFKVQYTLVNVASLESFDDGATVDHDAVLARGLTQRTGNLLKVLGMGEIGRKLTVKAHKFSGTAKSKIEAAGGTAEVIA
jgi:large subunit ribosomal protein L15